MSVLEEKKNCNLDYYCPETPLHKAVREKNVEMVKKLLLQRVQINLQDKLGNSPLLLALASNDKHQKRYQDTWGRKRLDEISCLLINAGADVNVVNQKGRAPLHETVNQGRFEITKKLLLHRAKVNIQDNEGNSPLHYAAQNNSSELVRYLLENGADAKLASVEGYTALHCAIKIKVNVYSSVVDFRSEEIIWHLISAEANAQAMSNDGKAILLHFLDNVYRLDVLNPSVIYALLECGANLSVDDILQNFERINKDFLTDFPLGKILIKAFIKMENVRKHEMDKKLWEKCSYQFIQYYEECNFELACLKSTKLCNHITFYDILVKPMNKLIALTRNKYLMSVMESGVYNFKIYGNWMAYRMRLAKEREKLYVTCKKVVTRLIRVTLPCHILDQILNHMSVIVLKNLAEV